MKAHSAASAATFLIATLVAGCAPDGTLATNGLNTSAINQEPVASQKVDPACVTLASQIDVLNQEGIADKVSKAAEKKYKMKAADLTKADELNKAHAEFQTKCSSYPPSPVVATAAPAEAPPKTAKAKPPVPSPKPVAAAMAPQPTPEALGQAPAQP
jgi:hypothetical protein